MWIPHGECFHAGHASTGIEVFSVELIFYTPTVIVNYGGPFNKETKDFA